MQTLAITGASGFLGRHLVSECTSRPGYELRVLTRNPGVFEDVVSDKVTICEGDLLKPESLGGFLQRDCTLVHLAYISGEGTANVSATDNLIRAARESGVRRVVHCSTAVVVGRRARGIVTEDTVPEPCGSYQETKYGIEQALRAGLPPTVELAILRPTEIIGPGGRGLRTMIERVRCAPAYKQCLFRFMLRNRRFNYVSVHNVVAALMLLASASDMSPVEIYNVADDDDPDNNYAAVEEVVRSALHLEAACGFDIGLPRGVLSLLFRLLPGAAPPDRVYSQARLEALGYRKVVTMKEAISELLSSAGAVPS